MTDTINPLIHGNLSPEVVRECTGVHEKIREMRARIERGQPVPPGDLLNLGEYLISFRFWISAHLLEAEASYRDKVEEFREEGKSVSAAESKAQITPEYRGYKFLKRLDDLVDEQVLLVKKFESRMDDERRMSR